MTTFQEKRRINRIPTVWKVLVNHDQNIKSYVRDFSKTGLRLWLNMINGFTDKKLLIQIPHPEKPYLIPLELSIYPVWVKKYDHLQFSEVGCKIEELDVHQEMQLNELLDLFKSFKRFEEIKIKISEK